MKTDDITLILDTLKDVNEKLEGLNIRFNMLERAKDEVLQDLKKLKQSLELLKGSIRSKQGLWQIMGF